MSDVDAVNGLAATQARIAQLQSMLAGSLATTLTAARGGAALGRLGTALTESTAFDDLLGQVGRGDHLILSIADTAPPDMKFSRLEMIAKAAREFGPVKP